MKIPPNTPKIGNGLIRIGKSIMSIHLSEIHAYFTLCLLVPSADNLGKQFGTRSGQTKSSDLVLLTCTEKRINTSLKDLSIALNNHDRHAYFHF